MRAKICVQIFGSIKPYSNVKNTIKNTYCAELFRKCMQCMIFACICDETMRQYQNINIEAIIEYNDIENILAIYKRYLSKFLMYTPVYYWIFLGVHTLLFTFISANWVFSLIKITRRNFFPIK